MMRSYLYCNCGGENHPVTLEDDGDEIVVSFLSHTDIEKDALIASMRGTTRTGDCYDIFSEVSGGGGKGFSLHLFDTVGHQDLSALARLMLQAGADPNVQDSQENTVLKMAIVHENLSRVHELLEAGADPNISDRYGMAPLHTAAFLGCKTITMSLLDAGADPNVADEDGETPLLIAAAHSSGSGYFFFSEDHAKVFGLLLQAGADIDAKNKKGHGWEAKVPPKYLHHFYKEIKKYQQVRP